MAHEGRLIVVRTSKATAAEPARPCTIPTANGRRHVKQAQIFPPLRCPSHDGYLIRKNRLAVLIVGMHHRAPQNYMCECAPGPSRRIVIHSIARRITPVRFNTPSRISMNPTDNSMLRPSLGGIAV